MATIVLDILLLAMLVAGIYTVFDKKVLLAIALLLAIPMFGGRWSNYFYTDPVLLEIDYGFWVMFFCSTQSPASTTFERNARS